MRGRERTLLRSKLDREMKPFRQAGMDADPTNGLLRAVRRALRIPSGEIASGMGMHPDSVFDIEEREMKNTITLRTLSKYAEAIGCKVVYGIVPLGGKTLEEVAEERMWRERLKGGE